MVHLAVNGQTGLKFFRRCDACPFAFTKLADSPSVRRAEVIDVLRQGMDEISDQVIELVRKGLTPEEYLLALLEVTSLYVVPSNWRSENNEHRRTGSATPWLRSICA